MTKGNTNKILNSASKQKKDEFYTQLKDIENELRHYKNHFKNKVVYCNCDDPRVSNFFNYFALNFEHLQLKNLLLLAIKIKIGIYSLKTHLNKQYILSMKEIKTIIKYQIPMKLEFIH